MRWAWGIAIAIVLICYFTFYRKKKITIKTLLLFVPLVVTLAWNQIYYYFFSSIQGDSARYQLLINSFKVIKDHFPIGSGFGTYASYYSGKYYSPIYSSYGLTGIYGLTRDNTSFISDSFWPMVFAQTGLIGTVTFPSSCETKVKQCLSTFDAISVREEAAKRIVEENTGRTDVEVLIDPTMMLCPEDWDRVIKKPKDLTNKRYVVCYFLGTLTDEYRTAISQLAEREECTIVDLSNAESSYYCCGPSEFVYLIKNAVYVCTDSFHASVFSILYNRPFVVFNRNGKHNTMGSRIQTLLSTFHLEDARFTGIIDESYICRDYKEVNQIVENERQKALRFIRKALR